MAYERFGYNNRLPEYIREHFMLVAQDIASLHGKWMFYQKLFGDQETTALLDDLARSSFQIIEESLRTDMIMAISRLGDPCRSVGGKDNLSLFSLMALAQRSGCICNADKMLSEFATACKPFRQYRNKSVGHNDLTTRIKPHKNLLPAITPSQVDDVLELSGNIMNAISQHFIHGSEELRFVPFGIGGADDLLFWLKSGREHEGK